MTEPSAPTPARGAGVSVREAAASDRATWDHLVLRRCGGNPLGTWGWGDLRARFGWEVVRLLAEVDGVARGALWLQLRPAAGRLTAFAYAPRGPHVADPGGADRPVALELVAAAIRLARRRRALVLKLDPEWRIDDDAARATLALAGTRDSWYDVQHRKTYLVDLEGGPDAVLGRLKESTRRNLRLAERAGVVVEHAADAEAAARLHPLLVESGRRNGFEPREAAYFEALVEDVGRSCPVTVLLASVDGALAGGVLAVAAGPRLVYLYGGNTLEHSRARPAYALQWAAIRWGIERGCRTYDMWGVPNHEDATRPGFGYYEFKRRWNGRVERHIRCQEVRLWPPLGPLPRLAERLALRGRPLLT